MKMKMIRLVSTDFIRGVPRSPIEGIQTVDEAEYDRLIAAGHKDAEADVSREDDDGDGLEAKGMTERKLRDIAKREGTIVEGDADKPTIIAAIRSRRELFAGTGVDIASDEDLRKVASDESLTVPDGADTAGLIGAIAQGRAAKA